MAESTNALDWGGTPKLTRQQAAIVGLYTGIVCGPFSDVHQLAEHLVAGPIWTHEFPRRAEELKELVKPLFFEICTEG